MCLINFLSLPKLLVHTALTQEGTVLNSWLQLVPSFTLLLQTKLLCSCMYLLGEALHETVIGSDRCVKYRSDTKEGGEQ